VWDALTHENGSLMAISPAPVSHPADYDYVFRKYRSFLYGVVYHSGVPIDQVEEASGEIFVRMMATDGLARFDGSVTDETNPRRLRAYLACYFSLGARAEITRIRTHDARTEAFDTNPKETGFELGNADIKVLNERRLPHQCHQEDPFNNVLAEAAADEPDLLDRLLDLLDGDARVFVQVASGQPTYAKARAELVEMGWDSLRIRAAVKKARRLVRGACTPQ
jgi:hypothetical protein